MSVRPRAPKREEPVFHLGARDLARKQAADADADPQGGQGKAGRPVFQTQLGCVIRHDRRRDKGGDRPDEDLANQRQA